MEAADLVELALDSSQHVVALDADADEVKQVGGCSFGVRSDHMTPHEIQNAPGTTASVQSAHALVENSGRSLRCHSPLDSSLCCSRSFARCCSWTPGGGTPL